MNKLGLVNAYGPAGFVLTMPLAHFLAGATPAIKAADDAPPDGKPPAQLVYPDPAYRVPYVPADRYTAPAVGGPPPLDRTRRPGKF